MILQPVRSAEQRVEDRRFVDVGKCVREVRPEIAVTRSQQERSGAVSAANREMEQTPNTPARRASPIPFDIKPPV